MKRTHRIQLYDPPAADPDPYDTAAPAWTAAGAPTPANLQPLTGSVQQTAAGRQVNASWKAFVPAGTPIDEGQGLVVLEGVGPKRYRVTHAGPQGGRWDTEALLDTTEEVIP